MYRLANSIWFVIVSSLACQLAIASHSRADLITSFNLPVVEQFDTLASSGTSGILPKDWKIFEAGTGANLTYSANNGSLATANTYSYGNVGLTERALGA